MIFLSHNNKDKEIVEPIAMKLSEIFGQNRVFYDSWSIQPGDGIVDKMNSGLESAAFLFLFVSQNSISSNMVKLEWQNALIRATNGECKIIPVRLDETAIPIILQQTLYLDLYSNGFDIVIRQMIDVIKGKNTFHSQYPLFSNIEGIIEKHGENYKVIFSAKHFMEPTSMYLICIQNNEEEISYTIESDSVHVGGFNKNISLDNGNIYNAIFIHALRATTPQNPVVVTLKPKNNSNIKIACLMKGENNHDFHTIPTSTKIVS